MSYIGVTQHEDSYYIIKTQGDQETDLIPDSDIEDSNTKIQSNNQVKKQKKKLRFDLRNNCSGPFSSSRFDTITSPSPRANSPSIKSILKLKNSKRP